MYINTFQRGPNESVWETIPFPCWEEFKFGAPSSGFLSCFIKDNYSKQWRYTTAPDAECRVIQNMYKLKDLNLPIDVCNKVSKMGDYLRYCLFDKYFKPLGCQDKTKTSNNLYDSCHYLISWYSAFGGSTDPTSGWAWRIGSSHVHFGYQNPLSAYTLTSVDKFKPK